MEHKGASKVKNKIPVPNGTGTLVRPVRFERRASALDSTLCQIKNPRTKRYRDSGTPGAIRTHDLQSRSLTLYPAELRAHFYQLAVGYVPYYTRYLRNLQALFSNLRKNNLFC